MNRFTLRGTPPAGSIVSVENSASQPTAIATVSGYAFDTVSSSVMTPDAEMETTQVKVQTTAVSVARDIAAAVTSLIPMPIGSMMTVGLLPVGMGVVVRAVSVAGGVCITYTVSVGAVPPTVSVTAVTVMPIAGVPSVMAAMPPIKLVSRRGGWGGGKEA